MIALPFHPSNVYTIREFHENACDILAKVEQEGRTIEGNNTFSLRDKLRNGRLHVQQTLVSGCVGGLFENIAAMADILRGSTILADQTPLGINPSSDAIALELIRYGITKDLMLAGATIRSAICGPCYGVCDIPANNTISLRHVARNFPNREGSKPPQGQMAAVELADARSVAATAKMGGYLTAATELDASYRQYDYRFDSSLYERQVYNGYGAPKSSIVLQMGPNIADWPEFPPLKKHMLLLVAGAYKGSLTTDELIPSGDTASYRSNPHKISEFTLSSKDPGYVGRAKEIRAQAERLAEFGQTGNEETDAILSGYVKTYGVDIEDIAIGSVITCNSIGDGSSREHAVSCQKVLGGWANITGEYANKRYYSNLINWGMLPLFYKGKMTFKPGDFLFLPGIKEAVATGKKELLGYLSDNTPVSLILGEMTQEERDIMLAGNVMRYYKDARV